MSEENTETEYEKQETARIQKVAKANAEAQAAVEAKRRDEERFANLSRMDAVSFSRLKREEFRKTQQRKLAAQAAKQKSA